MGGCGQTQYVILATTTSTQDTVKRNVFAAGDVVSGAASAYILTLWAMGIDSTLADLACPESDIEGRIPEAASRGERVRYSDGLASIHSPDGSKNTREKKE